MAAVITETQARQITGGRKPLVPVVYEEACRALQACVDLDEAKYWDNKADALAVWGKIHRDGTVTRQAKLLKLRASRRMGELAAELYPRKSLERGSGCAPGAVKGLQEHGITKSSAEAALRLSKATEKEFSTVLESARGPIAASREFRGRGNASSRSISSDAWVWLMGAYGASSGACLARVRSVLGRRAPRDVAAELSAGEAAKAREIALAVTEWLDEFEQYLPKGAD